MFSYPVECEIPYEKIGAERPEHPPRIEEFFVPYSIELADRPRPAVIICPGGGYDYCSEREGIPVALRFAGYGVPAIVFEYSCRMRFPTALTELAAVVAHVREHYAKYGVDPDRIAVAGFSAGAHLAASLAVYWNKPLLSYFGERCRPNAQILCYPVITAGEAAHRGSIANLIGWEAANDFTSAAAESVSLEKQVTADTPPCFLWHTSDDNCVPVQNSLLYLQALAENGVPFESHIWPHGAHGLSLSDETTAKDEWHLNTVCEPWFADCIRWIRRVYQ